MKTSYPVESTIVGHYKHPTPREYVCRDMSTPLQKTFVIKCGADAETRTKTDKAKESSAWWHEQNRRKLNIEITVAEEMVVLLITWDYTAHPVAPVVKRLFPICILFILIFVHALKLF